MSRMRGHTHTLAPRRAQLHGAVSASKRAGVGPLTTLQYAQRRQERCWLRCWPARLPRSPCTHSLGAHALMPRNAVHCRTALLFAQKLIEHAIRFTGPNSRQAYELPAEHFAPHGKKRVCRRAAG